MYYFQIVIKKQLGSGSGFRGFLDPDSIEYGSKTLIFTHTPAGCGRVQNLQQRAVRGLPSSHLDPGTEKMLLLLHCGHFQRHWNVHNITIPKLKLANGVLFIFHQEVITGFRAFSFSCPICKRKHGRQSPGVYQRNVLLFYFWFLLLFLPTSPVGRCNIINNFFGDVAELLSLPFCSLILYPILSPMRIRIQPFPHCEFGSKRCTLI